MNDEGRPKTTAAVAVMDPKEKKVKGIYRKLKQIDELKKRVENGDKLELTQLDKIKTEQALRKELELLKV